MRRVTRIINIRSGQPYDIYIGRQSRWGNPFVIGRDGTRAEVIAKYERWLQTQPALLVDLCTLRGKTLACWCKPAICHGDSLARLADSLPGGVSGTLKSPLL